MRNLLFYGILVIVLDDIPCKRWFTDVLALATSQEDDYE